ncbi:MAG: branched-chain amino acid ABC transporter permease [Bacteriovoracia bacterium]
MMHRTLRSYLPWAYAVACCIGLAVLVYPNINPYYQSIFMIACINIILATSLTLINGFTGQFSLGHAGFMAVGGYTTAALTIFVLPKLGIAASDGFFQQLFFLLSLIVGGAFAAFCGYLVGLPSLRLKGDYLAIVTLGFGEIIRVMLLNIEFLGGARGLSGIITFTNHFWLIFLALASSFSAFRLLGTPTARAMFSVREDEIAAEAMGVNTTGVKVKAFVVSSFWAGIAGGLYAHYYGYLNPSIFGFMKSFEVVVIIVLGGLGSVSGAVLAAVGLTILPEALRPLQEITRLDFRMILYSLILILFMLLKPDGLLGRREIAYYWRKYKNRGKK